MNHRNLLQIDEVYSLHAARTTKRSNLISFYLISICAADCIRVTFITYMVVVNRI